MFKVLLGLLLLAVQVSSVNQCPTFFTKGNIIVNEDDGAVRIEGWAFFVSPGVNESSQLLSWNVSVANISLFDVQPTVSWNNSAPTVAAISFTTKSNAFGSTQVVVSAIDDGGTAGGGCDMTTTTATLTITAVNDPPSFTIIVPSVSVDEDHSGNFPAFATSISPGPGESEAVQFILSFLDSSQSSLFSAFPAISPNGTLTFTPAPDANVVSCQLYVQLRDAYGAVSCSLMLCDTITITINSVNDPATFTLLQGTISVYEDLRNQFPAPTPPRWSQVIATNISSGPANEGAQQISFSVSVDNAGLFAVLPTVTTNGTLSFTLATRKNGQSSITLVISDDGPTPNTGVTRSLLLTVDSVNNPPNFTVTHADPLLLQRNGPVTVLATFLSDLRPGPIDAVDEVNQTLAVAVSAVPALFQILEASITATGFLNLTIQPFSQQYGNSIVTISITDNGGTLRGGIATTVHTVNCSIAFLNNPPELTLAQAALNVTQLDSSGALTVDGDLLILLPAFYTVSPGLSESAIQTVSLNASASPPSALVGVPALNNGVLTLTISSAFSGTAILTFTATDDYQPPASVVKQTLLTVRPVNRCPKFVLGGDLTYTEGVTTIFLPGYITNVSAGRSSESSQTLTWSTITSNSTFFTSNPTVIYNTSTPGKADVSFILNENAFGVMLVEIQLRDDGGTLDGGCNTFSRTMKILIDPVNDPPSMTVTAASIVVSENSGTTVISNWATGISAGPFETEVLIGNLTFLNQSQSDIFVRVPSLDTVTGSLTFEVKANRNSQGQTVQFKMQLIDSFGAPNCPLASCPVFGIVVGVLNDLPTFLRGADVVVFEDFLNINPTRPPSELWIDGWATGISVGSNEEAVYDRQTAYFTSTNNATLAFSIQPHVFPNGTLHFGLGADQNGAVNVSVTVWDTGAAPNQGPTKSFMIYIYPVNDPPTMVFSLPPPLVMPKDTGFLSYPSFGTGVTPGPTAAADEAAQTVVPYVSSFPPSLFSILNVSIQNGRMLLGIQPALNLFGNATLYFTLQDNGGIDRGGVDQIVSNFSVVVTDFNYPPDFTLNSTIVSILEDAYPSGYTVVGFARNISAGPGEDGFQTRTFSTVNDRNSLFKVQPKVDDYGTLTFTAADDAFGEANVYITLRDNGNPSKNTSKGIVISITSVNDCPSFVSGGDVTVNEVSSSVVTKISSWATSVRCGPSNEQNQSLTWTVNVGDATLFDIAPQMEWSSSNPSIANLKFGVKPYASGVTTATIYSVDDGGSSNGGCDTSRAITILININRVNQAPSFVFGNPRISVDEDAGLTTISKWATSISAGAPNEGSQTLWFETQFLNSSQTSLFTTVPTIDSSTGDLKFQFAPNVNTFNGPVQLYVRIVDNGNTSGATPSCAWNSCNILTLVCNPVNDPPSFVSGGNIVVWEDMGQLTPTPANRSMTVLSWATSIDVGGTFERLVEAQIPIFDLTYTNPSLFATRPTLDVNGSLTLTLAPDQNGISTVTVTIRDSGSSPGNSGTSSSFTVTVSAVNDAPSFFARQTRFSVQEDASAAVLDNFLLSVAPGPATASDETSQTLQFAIQTNATVFDSTLFSSQPSIDSSTLTNPKLRFQPSPDRSGNATFTLVIFDNGGRSLNGVDRAFIDITIQVDEVNDPPTFNVDTGSVSVIEDTGTSRFSGIISGVSAGANELQQRVTINCVVDHPEYFEVAPNLTASGVLTFKPSPDAFGTANVAISLVDDGVPPLTSAQKQLTITIRPKNDPPTFSLRTNLVNVTACTAGGACSIFLDGLVSNVSVGPANEASQSISFSVNVPSGALALFSVAPTVAADGTLSFTLATGKNTYSTGPARLEIVGRDSGGTADGGNDATSAFLLLTVKPIIPAPTMTISSPTVSVNEDSTTVTVLNFVSNIVREGYSIDPLQFRTGVTVGGSLFSPSPTLTLISTTSTGTLMFTPVPDEVGTASLFANLFDPESGKYSDNLTFSITIREVNDPPTFDIRDIDVFESSGAFTGVLISNISVGPRSEKVNQFILSASVTCADASFFTVAPLLTVSGRLTFTLKDSVVGSTTCTATLQDNGGVQNGGEDQRSKPFRISIARFNRPPSFVGGATVNILEDSFYVAQWATQVSPGPGESQQKVNFTLSCNPSAVFRDSTPMLSPVGILTARPDSNANGQCDCTVTLRDDGPDSPPNQNVSPSSQLTVNVIAVNDAPTFVRGNNVFAQQGAGLLTYTAWATNISSGPPDEAGQSLQFFVSGDGLSTATDYFPTILIDQARSPMTATLRVQFKSSYSGLITASVCLKDSGGVENGGQDQTCLNVIFSVAPVNQRPTYAVAAAVTILENSGENVVTGFLTNVSPGQNETSQTASSSVQCSSSSQLILEPKLRSNGDLSVTPQANQFGEETCNVTVTDSLGLSVSQPFVIRVLSVNNPPTFRLTRSTLIVDQGSEVNVSIATEMDPGALNERSQRLTFLVVLPNNSLAASAFQAGPSIDAKGYLLAKVDPQNFFGEIQLRILLVDDGGTVRGGSDTSQQQTLLLQIRLDNKVPQFVAGPNVVILEDSGLYTQPSWATAISAGSVSEDRANQTVRFLAQPSQQGLFALGPQVSALGTLEFSPAPNAFGTTQISLTLLDGFGLSSRTAFSVTIVGVNDPPDFVHSGNVTINEDTKSVISGWAMSITAGPNEDATQSVKFFASNFDVNKLDSVQVDPVTGDMTVTPKLDAFGWSRCDVTLQDNGTVENGGINQKKVSIWIFIRPVNDPPSLRISGDITANLQPGQWFKTSSWILEANGGPNEEDQACFTIVEVADSDMFTSAPEVNLTLNELRFLPAMNGSTSAKITLVDNGGLRTSITFQINVILRTVEGTDQLAPRFDLISDSLEVQAGSSIRLPVCANMSTALTRFEVETISNPVDMFLQSPIVSTSGILSFVSGTTGNAILKVVGLSSIGLRFGPKQISLVVTAPLLLRVVLSTSVESFNSDYFKSVIADQLKIETKSVVIVSVTAGSCVVDFYLRNDTWDATAAQLTVRLADTSDPLTVLLGVKQVTAVSPSGFNNTAASSAPPSPAPSGAVAQIVDARTEPQSNSSISRSLGIIAGILIFLLIVVAVLVGYRCFKRRQRTGKEASDFTPSSRKHSIPDIQVIDDEFPRAKNPVSRSDVQPEEGYASAPRRFTVL